MLEELLKRIQSALRERRFSNEAAISQGVVLPILRELQWPDHDTQVVYPEYTVKGRRVDFALCPRPNRPLVFIEVKQLGQSAGADKQLFEYAFHVGIPMAVLTDGQEWNFYLPAEPGDYEERRVYKLDLLERDLEESTRIFERYLGYQEICSGKAITDARTDYQNVARKREIEATIPKAWQRLLEEPEQRLVDLVAEKVESLCGYKPDMEPLFKFLLSRSQQSGPDVKPRPPAGVSVFPPKREDSVGCDLGKGVVLQEGEKMFCFRYRSSLRAHKPEGVAEARNGRLFIEGQEVRPSKGSLVQPALKVIQRKLRDISPTTGELISLDAWDYWYVERAGNFVRVGDLRDPNKVHRRI
jgi:hypothetical protein